MRHIISKMSITNPPITRSTFHPHKIFRPADVLQAFLLCEHLRVFKRRDMLLGFNMEWVITGVGVASDGNLNRVEPMLCLFVVPSTVNDKRKTN
jgi:hypothetical protein